MKDNWKREPRKLAATGALADSAWCYLSDRSVEVYISAPLGYHLSARITRWQLRRWLELMDAAPEPGEAK